MEYPEMEYIKVTKYHLLLGHALTTPTYLVMGLDKKEKENRETQRIQK